jgi:hypothetical protein
VEDGKPKREKGGAPEIALAERHKASNLEDGIRAKIMKVDAIKIEEATKDFRGRERKTTLQEAQKYDELTGLRLWLVLPSGISPFPGILLWQHSPVDEGAEMPLFHGGTASGSANRHGIRDGKPGTYRRRGGRRRGSSGAARQRDRARRCSSRSKERNGERKRSGQTIALSLPLKTTVHAQ